MKAKAEILYAVLLKCGEMHKKWRHCKKIFVARFCVLFTWKFFVVAVNIIIIIKSYTKYIQCKK